jgi:hypothetical protein
MPKDFARTICIDKDNNKWISYISAGLYVFNDDTLYTYNPQNSGLKSKWVTALAADKLGNVWIGEDGLTVFRRGGVILSTESCIKSPSSYFLKQNYPNPFNPVTTISYSLPKESYVEMSVFDILGRKITTLVNIKQNAGEYNVQFDGSSLSSGMYIYSILAGQYKASRKLVLLK